MTPSLLWQCYRRIFAVCSLIVLDAFNSWLNSFPNKEKKLRVTKLAKQFNKCAHKAKNKHGTLETQTYKSEDWLTYGQSITTVVKQFSQSWSGVGTLSLFTINSIHWLIDEQTDSTDNKAPPRTLQKCTHIPLYRVVQNKLDYLLFVVQVLYFYNKTRKYDYVRVAPRTLVKVVLNVSSTGCNKFWYMKTHLLTDAFSYLNLPRQRWRHIKY